MTEFAKYSYEHLDAVGAALAPPPPRKRAYTDAQIEDIREEAFNDGITAGEKSALTRIEMRCAETLTHISTQIPDLYTDVSEKIILLQKQSADLALLISKVLAPALIAREPLVEIEQLFAACVSHLRAEPRIVIRMEEGLVESLKDKLENVARQAGYPGRIVLLGEPDSLPAQCQIEWADGGVTHRSPEQLAIIEKMISHYVTGANTDAGHEDAISN